MKALIVTGEASGDIYGGRLADALRERVPGITIAGMGGPQMELAGVRLLYAYGHVSVVGVFEVFGKLQHLRNAFAGIRRWIEDEKPDFAVLVDFPDFNFRVARFLKSRGIKTYYFISPQVWAWRKSRVNFLRNHIDLMVCILPFEEQLYKDAHVPVVYVGHPLVEIVRTEVAHQPEIPAGNRLRLGLMPGSRDVEVRRHLPVLLETLSVVRRSKDVDALLIWPPSLTPGTYQVPPELDVVTGDRYAAMRSCDLLLVTSGTSTLECAILGAPLLIVYRVAPITWWLGKVLVRVPYYGLVNWIAGRKVVPEYIQQDMSPEVLAREALRYLDDTAARSSMKQHLKNLVETLGPPGAIDRAADAILKQMSR